MQQDANSDTIYATSKHCFDGVALEITLKNDKRYFCFKSELE